MLAPVTPQAFWSWFAANGQWFVMPPDPRFLQDIANNLQQIDAGLGFEIAATRPPTLAISASGNRLLFDLVREVVRVAPAMPFVRVVPFRQRGPVAGFAMRCSDGSTLGADDIWFHLQPSPEGLGLHLFVRNFPTERPGHVQEDVYVLLDNALGEEDVVTRIGWIEWGSLPVQPTASGLHPLSALPAQFDAALGRRSAS